MQASITAFFKPKNNDSGEQAKVTNKRVLDSEEDSDDEGHIMTAKNNKRRALSSTETTPTKLAAKNETAETTPIKMETNTETAKTTPTKLGPKAEATETTPIKLAVRTVTAVQSPLMNTELLVRKKISSGASALHENIGITWFDALKGEFDKPYFKKLSTFVEQQRKTKTVYPPPEQVYTWTHYHTIRDTRVVVIGQDPYHGPNQAHGLSFSVAKGVAVPKSLQNIYKELQSDIPNFKHPGHGNLTGWSKQGVLMLNACLTVNSGEANSHRDKGWETFTDSVISWISKNVKHNVVFLLWGNYAQKKRGIIDKRHKILTSVHPSPLSADRGFFGCKHFSQTNAYLKSQKLTEVDWAAL